MFDSLETPIPPETPQPKAELPRSILERNPTEVPIRDADVEKFKAWFCQTTEDTALFNKLMANIRMIDASDFSRGINRMEQAIAKFVGEDEYDLLIDSHGKSGDLMLSTFNLEGKPPRRILRVGQISEPSESYQQGVKLVVADDAAYSSDRIQYMLNDLKIPEGARQNVFVGAVAMTHTAQARLQDTGLTAIDYTFMVPTLDEILTPEEIELYRQKMIEGGLDLLPDGYLTRVLTFTYAKVPDNFLPGFRRTKSVFKESPDGESLEQMFIIDDTPEGVYPPYRKS